MKAPPTVCSAPHSGASDFASSLSCDMTAPASGAENSAPARFITPARCIPPRGGLDPESIDVGGMISIGSSTTEVRDAGRDWSHASLPSNRSAGVPHPPWEHMKAWIPLPTAT